MSDWIAQHFLHSSYVLPWGVALAAVPVIVHLINRLRFRRVRFAAMEFLLKSQQRNRRRLLIEQLLLLLLRIGIVAALLMLISRLVLDPSALWAFRGGKSHHVVILDDSGSMRDRWGETSAFREALATVRRLAAEGARRPKTQQCTLVLLSKPDRPLFFKRDVDNLFVAELENTFERLECTHRALDLENGVDAAARILAQDPAMVRHLHVISDFRAADWKERPALRAAFVAISKSGTSIDLARTVSESHENLAITNFGGEARNAAAGVPVRLSITVHNYGEKVAEHVRVAVFGDGNLLPQSIEIDRLDAGTDATREFDVAFPKPGKHSVEVRLPDDALPADNRRFTALEINIANPVLIIDGNPESDDGSYVATALAADPKITGYSPRIEGPDFLRKEPLAPFSCIYLLNVPQLQADSVKELADYVKRGGGIAWFLGDVVKTPFYNDVLYKEQAGLFPVRLANTAKQMVRADESSNAAEIAFARHPVFRIFEGADNPFVAGVRINTWIPVAGDWERDDNRRRDDVATIATLPGKEPLAFERRYGKGRIFAFLSSAGPKWNDWGRNPSVVVFQLELARRMSRSDASIDPRTVGKPIEISFNPAEFLETVEITAPDANGQRVTRLRARRARAAEQPPAADAKNKPGAAAKTSAPPAKPAGGSGAKSRDESVRAVATYAETDRPGLYIVRLFKDQAAMPQERWSPYNVPASESDLKVATTAEILARLSGDVHVMIHEPGAFNWIEGHSASQEARNLLLVFLAAALVAEQLFAHRLSYLPSPTKGAA